MVPLKPTFVREEIRITLANWCILCDREYLYPIYERLHGELLKREIIHVDETTCQVLREEEKKLQSASYMWTYRSGSDGLPVIILYESQPERSSVQQSSF